MKLKEITAKQWVFLSLLLLVLVVFLLAYYVFVPKQQELANLQKDLQTAQQTVKRLEKVALPRQFSDAEKLLIAEQTPVVLEQSRLIKTIRQQETDAGVTIRKLEFSAADEEDEAKAEKAKTKTNTKKKTDQPDKQTVFKEAKVRIELDGKYEQVREFLALFAGTQRLITVTNWNFESKDDTAAIKELAAQKNPPSITSRTDGDIVRREVFWEDLLPTDLLRDRTPIYTQEAYDRVVEMIRARAPLFKNQHDKDIANLEIQQATNRYAAGKSGLKQSLTVLDLERADVFIEGANPIVRQVLAIPDGTAAKYPNGSTVVFLNDPMPALTAILPVFSQTQTAAKTPVPPLVKLEMEFIIYYAPDAEKLLPSLQPIDTYDPAGRTNPVTTVKPSDPVEKR